MSVLYLILILFAIIRVALVDRFNLLVLFLLSEKGRQRPETLIDNFRDFLGYNKKEFDIIRFQVQCGLYPFILVTILKVVNSFLKRLESFRYIDRSILY